MKTRPILFTAPMVRAILEGRKTQTRRIVKPPPVGGKYAGCAPAREMYGPKLCGKWGAYFGHQFIPCPYGQPDDQLWVKETWKPDPSWGQSNSPTMDIQEGSNILYRSTLPEDHAKHGFGKWRPSIFMRRWMSRLTLEIAAVRVERLNDISEEDAIAEGAFEREGTHGSLWRHDKIWEQSAKVSYRELWNSINGPDSWAKNPWVWVIEFKRFTP